MNRKFATRCVAVMLVLALACAVTVWAAPFAKQGAAIPDQVRSLADMKQLYLEFSPLPEVLFDQGVRLRDVRAQMVKVLTEAGLEVVEKDTTPKMSVTYVALTDPRTDEAVGFMILVDVQQLVHVHRIKVDLVLPTATIVGSEMTLGRDLLEAVMRQTKITIESFVNYKKAGSAPRK